MSSSQIFMARSADLPFAESGPVNDMPKPIRIGSWAVAGARVMAIVRNEMTRKAIDRYNT
jgi:hypothetical protein